MSGPQLNTILRIESVWMALSVDDDGTEGVCGVMLPSGMWMPLLAADEKRLPFILEQAEMVAVSQQRLIRIVKLTTREEYKVIDGRS
ncbi:hypothetical protein [Phyllobacterium sp. P5_D12]